MSRPTFDELYAQFDARVHYYVQNEMAGFRSPILHKIGQEELVQESWCKIARHYQPHAFSALTPDPHDFQGGETCTICGGLPKDARHRCGGCGWGPSAPPHLEDFGYDPSKGANLRTWMLAMVKYTCRDMAKAWASNAKLVTVAEEATAHDGHSSTTSILAARGASGARTNTGAIHETNCVIYRCADCGVEFERRQKPGAETCRHRKIVFVRAEHLERRVEPRAAEWDGQHSVTSRPEPDAPLSPELRRALDLLPEKERAILEHAFLDHLNDAEIATLYELGDEGPRLVNRIRKRALRRMRGFLSMRRQPERTSVRAAGLAPSTAKALEDGGVVSLADLFKATDAILLGIRGVNVKRHQEIRAARERLAQAKKA